MKCESCFFMFRTFCCLSLLMLFILWLLIVQSLMSINSVQINRSTFFFSLSQTVFTNITKVNKHQHCLQFAVNHCGSVSSVQSYRLNVRSGQDHHTVYFSLHSNKLINKLIQQPIRDADRQTGRWCHNEVTQKRNNRKQQNVDSPAGSADGLMVHTVCVCVCVCAAEQ